MASSYTVLGTEKMVTGEAAGTWGTKTNTNLEIFDVSTLACRRYSEIKTKIWVYATCSIERRRAYSMLVPTPVKVGVQVNSVLMYDVWCTPCQL